MKTVLRISFFSCLLLPSVWSQAAPTVTAVAAGLHHTLILESDGSLWAMGNNGAGQLGDGTTTDRHVPTLIVRSNVVAIAAGEYHSLFLTSDIGPMAQDFKHAFYPGRDDKSISTLEFDGVELAAIQGLDRKPEENETEIAELKRQNETLEKRLDNLAKVVKSLSDKN